jgi:hypothetical protein
MEWPSVVSWLWPWSWRPWCIMVDFSSGWENSIVMVAQDPVLCGVLCLWPSEEPEQT